jgi:hypothetical protein
MDKKPYSDRQIKIKYNIKAVYGIRDEIRKIKYKVGRIYAPRDTTGSRYMYRYTYSTEDNCTVRYIRYYLIVEDHKNKVE